jgi:hypothetical protein
MSKIPALTTSSTMIWIIGLSITGNITLGMTFEAGKNRVPCPAAKIRALLIFLSVIFK